MTDNVLQTLLEYDAHNVNESEKALCSVQPDAMKAVQAFAAVAQLITEQFGIRSGYDEHQTAIDKGLVGSGLRDADALDYLRHATLIGGSGKPDALGSAKGGMTGATAILARMHLALRIRRDFLFCIADLLRLRISTSLGFLRLQAEVGGLLLLMTGEPVLGEEWLESGDAEKGRVFHRKWHGQVVEAVKKLRLHGDYSLASNMALHPRASGTALGIVGGADGTRPGQIILGYQEGADPLFLFCWFATILRAHRRIVESTLSLFPELEPNFLEEQPCQEFLSLEAEIWERASGIHAKLGGEGLLARLTRKAQEVDPEQEG